VGLLERKIFYRPVDTSQKQVLVTAPLFVE